MGRRPQIENIYVFQSYCPAQSQVAGQFFHEDLHHVMEMESLTSVGDITSVRKQIFE